MNDQLQPALHRYLKLLLMGLVVFTVAALVWQHYRPPAELSITANTQFDMTAIDDRSATHKTTGSVAVLRRVGDKVIMECDISAEYEWPFCELSITLREPPEGVDLSFYDDVTLRLSVEGPGEPQLRFFARNFNEAYSDVGNPQTLKAMELLFNGTNEIQEYRVALSQLTVASWWNNEYPTSLEHVGVELDNVSMVSVSTGGHVVPGRHVITLESITFSGDLISDAKLRLFIIIAWVVCIIGYLVADAVVTRRQLSSVRQTQSSLRKVNEALLLESKSYADLARHDALTGVLNRHGLRDVLLDAVQINDPALFPLSLAFMDLDHFKSLNDEYGHSVGDQVLKEMTAQIKQTIKRNDLITRWGGEEFLLLFPGTTSAEAVEVIERIRKALKSLSLPQQITITCSFGVTEVGKNEELATAIERADAAMYRAKKNGRNRVEVNDIDLPS